MCGIAATVLVRSDAPSEPSPLPLPLSPSWSPISSPSLVRRGPDHQAELTVGAGRVSLGASVLHMRGESVGSQPMRDAGGNVLLWNGEVFGGGVVVEPGTSDTCAVLAALGPGRRPVDEVLSSVEGPWAFVFWHEASSTLWYGRDPLGRRSLLLRREGGAQRSEPAASAGAWERISVCSVAVASPQCGGLGTLGVGGYAWKEMPTDGIASVQLLANGGAESNWHPWARPWTRAATPATSNSQLGAASTRSRCGSTCTKRRNTCHT